MAEWGSLPGHRSPEAPDSGVRRRWGNGSPFHARDFVLHYNQAQSACLLRFCSVEGRTNFLASCEKLAGKGFPGQVPKPWPLIGRAPA